jgi:hypothetical protein
MSRQLVLCLGFFGWCLRDAGAAHSDTETKQFSTVTVHGYPMTSEGCNGTVLYHDTLDLDHCYACNPLPGFICGAVNVNVKFTCQTTAKGAVVHLKYFTPHGEEPSNGPHDCTHPADVPDDTFNGDGFCSYVAEAVRESWVCA